MENLIDKKHSVLEQTILTIVASGTLYVLSFYYFGSSWFAVIVMATAALIVYIIGKNYRRRTGTEFSV